MTTYRNTPNTNNNTNMQFNQFKNDLFELIFRFLERRFVNYRKPQKQPSSVVLKKKCSENIHQIYSRTPMPKCDFTKVALQLY